MPGKGGQVSQPEPRPALPSPPPPSTRESGDFPFEILTLGDTVPSSGDLTGHKSCRHRKLQAQQAPECNPVGGTGGKLGSGRGWGGGQSRTATPTHPALRAELPPVCLPLTENTPWGQRQSPGTPRGQSHPQAHSLPRVTVTDTTGGRPTLRSPFWDRGVSLSHPRGNLPGSAWWGPGRWQRAQLLPSLLLFQLSWPRRQGP